MKVLFLKFLFIFLFFKRKSLLRKSIIGNDFEKILIFKLFSKGKYVSTSPTKSKNFKDLIRNKIGLENSNFFKKIFKKEDLFIFLFEVKWFIVWIL